MTFAPVIPIYERPIEYLASKATPEEILEFQAQKMKMHEQKNCLSEIAPEHSPRKKELELEQMLHFDGMVSVLKAKAAVGLKTA